MTNQTFAHISSPLSENPVDPEIFEQHFDWMLNWSQICTFYSRVKLHHRPPSPPLQNVPQHNLQASPRHLALFANLYSGCTTSFSLSRSVATLVKNFIGLPLSVPRPGANCAGDFPVTDLGNPLHFSKEHLGSQSAQGWHPSYYLDWGRKHKVQVFLKIFQK